VVDGVVAAVAAAVVGDDDDDRLVEKIQGCGKS
jgi:hypothetical protein